MARIDTQPGPSGEVDGAEVDQVDPVAEVGALHALSRVAVAHVLSVGLRGDERAALDFEHVVAAGHDVAGALDDLLLQPCRLRPEPSPRMPRQVRPARSC